VKKIFKQILRGVAYCHRKGVAHRDIKLDNVLIGRGEMAKLIDFGFSTKMKLGKKVRMFCGTPSYMAPEILTKLPYSGQPSDIWALGVLLFVLLTGYFPFTGHNDEELFSRISTNNFTFPKSLKLSEREIINKMLVLNPDKRLTAQEILESKWINRSVVNKENFEKSGRNIYVNNKTLIYNFNIGRIEEVKFGERKNMKENVVSNNTQIFARLYSNTTNYNQNVHKRNQSCNPRSNN